MRSASDKLAKRAAFDQMHNVWPNVCTFGQMFSVFDQCRTPKFKPAAVDELFILFCNYPIAHCGFLTEILVTVLGMSSSTATRHMLDHSWNMLPLCGAHTQTQILTSWRWSSKMQQGNSADTVALLP